MEIASMETEYLLGNADVLRGEFESATGHYNTAIDLYHSNSYTEGVDFLLRSLANRGFCHMKLRNLASALEDFSSLLETAEIYQFIVDNKVLDITLPNMASWPDLVVKNSLRLISCYESVGEYRKALEALETLVKGHPELLSKTPSLSTQSLRLERLIVQDAAAAKLDGRPTWMAHAHQSLRLNLVRAVPMVISPNVPFTVKVALGNELGLFDRSMFTPSSSSVECLGIVHCRIVSLQSDAEMPFSVRLLCSQQSSPSIDTQSAICVPLQPDGKASMHLMMLSLSKTTPTDSCLIFPSRIHIMLEFTVDQFPYCAKGDTSNSIEVLPVITIPIEAILDSSIVSSHSGSQQLFSNLQDKIAEMRVNCLRPIIIPSDFSTDNDTVSEEAASQSTHDGDNIPRSRRILCAESVGLLGIGGKIWDSSFVLVRYLHHHRHRYITGKKVVELGAGTGITSLVLSYLNPASVVCTDLEEVVPLISMNFALNAQLNHDVRDTIQGSYHAVPYSWGLQQESDKELLHDFDTIVASDVIYYPEGYEPLLQSLESLLAQPSSSSSTAKKTCLLAHRHRHPEDPRFFAMLGSSIHLVVEEIDWKQENSSIRGNALQDVRLFSIRGVNT